MDGFGGHKRKRPDEVQSAEDLRETGARDKGYVGFVGAIETAVNDNHVSLDIECSCNTAPTRETPTSRARWRTAAV